MRWTKRSIHFFLGILLVLSFFGCGQTLADGFLTEESLTEEKKTEKKETEEALTEKETLIVPGDQGSFPLSLMSLNLRRPYDVDTEERSWQARREEIFDYLISSGADVICLQEAPRQYYEDLKENLSEDFLISQNVPNLILVRKGIFEIVEESNFYFSTTPSIKSTGWDASGPRSCQSVLLENRENGARFYVFNTHLDHLGFFARVESAKMIVEKLKTLEYPYFLLGDLNSTEEESPYSILRSVLSDASKAAPQTDSGKTFNDWEDQTKEGLPIDFILFCPINVEAKSFRICRDKWGEGNFYSDHYGVFAETEISY